MGYASHLLTVGVGMGSCGDNIEFAVNEIVRSREFYGKAFGWTFKDFGLNYCEFSDGRLTGGFAKGSSKSGGPLVILYAEDLAATQQRLGAAGAKIVKPVFALRMMTGRSLQSLRCTILRHRRGQTL